MSSVHAIIQARNADLIRRFREDMLPPHAALTDLAGAPSNPALGGGEIEALPGRRGPKIWRKATDHETSLWVPPAYGAYRAAFFDFLRHVYGTVDMTDALSYDVDHLFNRARASPNAMIRVEGVLAGINRSHGAGYEKTAGAGPVAQARQTDMRPFTKVEFISILKVLGLEAPTSAQDRPRMDRIRAESRRLGFPPDIIEAGISNMLAIANRR